MSRIHVLGLFLIFAGFPVVAAAQTDIGGGNGGTGGTGGQVGGGNTGGGVTQGADTGLTDPAELLNTQAEFEDIRNDVRFAGQSLDSIVHPYSTNFNVQEDISAIAGLNSAANGGAQGARTTTGLSGSTVQGPFGGFNSPFEALFFSQFQSQNAIIRSRLSFEPSEFLAPQDGSVPSVEVVAARRENTIQSHIRSLPNYGENAVNVQLTDGVAILNGTVSSEARKNQLARLVAMEPGVREVDNQLIVQ